MLYLGRPGKQEKVRSNVLTNNEVTRPQERTRTRAQQNLETNSFGKGLFKKIHNM